MPTGGKLSIFVDKTSSFFVVDLPPFPLKKTIFADPQMRPQK